MFRVPSLRLALAPCLALAFLPSAANPAALAAADRPAMGTALPQAQGGDPTLRDHATPVASYTLEASLDPTGHTITGRGTVRFRNTSRAAVGEVYVHLYLNAFKGDGTLFMRGSGAAYGFRGSSGLSDRGHIAVRRFGAPGGVDLWPQADKTSPGDPADETDIRVPLDAPLAPGDERSFELAWEAKLPAVVLRTGYSGGFHMVAQWFPKLARLNPDGTFAHFAFDHLTEFFADFGDYDVTIETPKDMLVGATGEMLSEVPAGGDGRPPRVRRRFVQGDVHDFAFAAWSKFEEILKVTPDGVRLRVLVPPGYGRIGLTEAEVAEKGLAFFGKAFGPYPYKTLTVVHPPEGAAEAGGMEYPTLITTGGAGIYAMLGAKFLETVTIHELGHQWFYGLVATDEHNHPFLDEGVNSFAEQAAMEALYGPGSALSLPGISVGIAPFSRMLSADVARNGAVDRTTTAFATGSDYGGLVYYRTATVFETLARVYGEDRTLRALGRYARRYRFEHPGPEELFAAMEEELGKEAGAQLRRAIEEQGTVDYSVVALWSRAAGDAPKGSKAAYTGEVFVRRRGSLEFPVEVAMYGKDGSCERVTWDGLGSVAHLPYRGASPIVAAVVDPDHKVLLDDDLRNNARRVSPPSANAGLIERLGSALEAALTVLIP